MKFVRRWQKDQRVKGRKDGRVGGKDGGRIEEGWRKEGGEDGGWRKDGVRMEDGRRVEEGWKKKGEDGWRMEAEGQLWEAVRLDRLVCGSIDMPACHMRSQLVPGGAPLPLPLLTPAHSSSLLLLAPHWPLLPPAAVAAD